MKCGCHPNCGIGTVLMVNKKTKQMGAAARRSSTSSSCSGRPADHRRRAQAVADQARRRPSACCATTGRRRRRRASGCVDLIKQFDKQSGGSSAGSARRRRRAAKTTSGASSSSPACGFRICGTTTSAAPRCASSPTARRLGEITFCAYNTGVGWRQIVEKMHKNATVAEWYKDPRQASGLRQPAQGRSAPRRRAAGGAEGSPRRAAGGVEAPTEAGVDVPGDTRRTDRGEWHRQAVLRPSRRYRRSSAPPRLPVSGRVKGHSDRVPNLHKKAGAWCAGLVICRVVSDRFL